MVFILPKTEDLLNREKRLLSILETTQDGFFIFDKNKKIIDVNKAYCEMSGYKKEEILNLSISDIDLYDTTERIKKVEENLLSKGHDLFETKHLKKNGEIIDIEVSISLFDEEPAVALCFCRDITEKKKYERTIIEKRDRLEKIIEGSNSGIWEWNIESGEIVINKKWAEIIGYSLDELSPITIETWEKLTHPDDLKQAQKNLRK